jgi:plasmid stability protein
VQRTTLTLDDDVAAKLKAVMRRSGRSFKDTVNEVLRFGLAQQAQVKKEKPFKIHAKNMGLRPGLDYDHISRLLEEVEGPTHR